MEKRRWVVIGGNNVDISATSLAPLVAGDSNPGRVHTGLGGVGRNIAENLTRLGHDVSLIAAFGEDGFAELALSQARRIGLDCSHALRVPAGASCVYICVNGPDGDMAVAVNDMALCERVTPTFLATRMDVVNAADAVVVDANLRGMPSVSSPSGASDRCLRTRYPPRSWNACARCCPACSGLRRTESRRRRLQASPFPARRVCLPPRASCTAWACGTCWLRWGRRAPSLRTERATR